MSRRSQRAAASQSEAATPVTHPLSWLISANDAEFRRWRAGFPKQMEWPGYSALPLQVRLRILKMDEPDEIAWG